ncbi:MAG: hypothetical protein HUU56_12760 [Bdellovibrionaceae bacterium]|nr:hypothetical protein [Pseudobdellovibrionaceae bacterium]
MGKIDLDSTTSKHKGVKGFFEIILRKFKTLMHSLLMIPIYIFAASSIGFSLIPGITLFRWVESFLTNESLLLQNFYYGMSLAIGYFLYGVSMLFIIPVYNFVVRGYLKEWRGPYYSVESIKWFLHNGLTYLVRFTFLEFVTPSPLNILFYQLMGMKIGRGVVINSSWISDPSLIEIGEKSTIGGSVTLVAHYGQGGMLIISPVKIGKGCTIGLKATIMGGVTIGDGAKILPHSVLLPKTNVPAGETWGGVPAAPIKITKSIKTTA